MAKRPSELQPYQRELIDRLVEKRGSRFMPRRLVLMTPRRDPLRSLYALLRAVIAKRP